MKYVRGIAAAPGVAIGPVVQFRPADLVVERRAVEQPDLEAQRFDRAVAAALAQVDEVYQKAKAELAEEDAAIFDAHRMMLQDPELLGAIKKMIVEERVNAEFAVQAAAGHFAQMLERMDDEYFRARAADVRDIAARLVRVLTGAGGPSMGMDHQAGIIIAQDLTPSDTILLDKEKVLGFCTVEGGVTAHTAILARGLGIPAVVGAGAEILSIPEGATVILDGAGGALIVDPADDVVDSYARRQREHLALAEYVKARCHEPAVTMDGVKVEVAANIGNIDGAKTAVEYGADGVGLLRTEFLYMERDSLPDEEEQFTAYAAILDALKGRPVILRTCDIGGDKALPYLDLPKELNPFLGVRGLRLGLLHAEAILKPQLRAAIRAAQGRDLRIMFPMVAQVEEVRQARKIFEECRDELLQTGKAAGSIQIGIMVEVPAAAVMADALAREVDFFSIGTNDLTQYTLAADRTNPQLSALSSAFSPAVLRLIQNVIVQAHALGKWVGLCGELAGEPLAIPILVGLGLDELSMNPQAIPAAKEIIRTVSAARCREVAAATLQLESAEAVQDYVRGQFADHPLIPPLLCAGE